VFGRGWWAFAEVTRSYKNGRGTGFTIAGVCPEDVLDGSTAHHATTESAWVRAAEVCKGDNREIGGSTG
jgi:hypothetical protein